MATRTRTGTAALRTSHTAHGLDDDDDDSHFGFSTEYAQDPWWQQSRVPTGKRQNPPKEPPKNTGNGNDGNDDTGKDEGNSESSERRSRRPRRRQGRGPPGSGDGNGGGGDDGSSHSSSTARSWNPALGPAPGVRWRSGAPPHAPAFDPKECNTADGFRKWTRQVEAWVYRAIWHAPRDELSLMLWQAVQGEASLEFESWDIQSDLAKADGIEKIIEFLRPNFSEKITRKNGETIRNYVMRYHRAERDLMTVGIDDEKNYDNEHRGFRLIDTCFLTEQAERQVLSTAGSHDFDKVRDALLYLFPSNTRPPPDSRGPKDGFRSNSQFQPKQRPGSSSSGGGHSGGGNAHPPKRTFVTTTEPIEEPPPDTIESAPTEEEHFEPAPLSDGEPLRDQDEEDDDESQQLAMVCDDLHNVLSVTAQKLKHLTLGRQYTSGRSNVSGAKASAPKKGACLGCGKFDHWWDDCPKNPDRGRKKGTLTSRPQPGPSSTYAPSALKTRPNVAPAPRKVHMASVFDSACDDGQPSEEYANSMCMPLSVSPPLSTVPLSSSLEYQDDRMKHRVHATLNMSGRASVWPGTHSPVPFSEFHF